MPGTAFTAAASPGDESCCVPAVLGRAAVLNTAQGTSVSEGGPRCRSLEHEEGCEVFYSCLPHVANGKLVGYL